MTATGIQRCEEFVVQGELEGDGYRDFVLGVAGRLAVRGFVKNLPGGAVQIVAEGDQLVLDELQALLASGPPGCRVQSIERHPHTSGGFTHFIVSH